MKALDEKEKIFVDEYLKTLNPREAALSAGYSESMAKSKVFTWVSESKCPKNKLHVLKAIQEAKIERSERTKIDSDFVLSELSEVWGADIGDIIGDHGELLPIKEWPPIWRKICTGISVREIFEYENKERKKVGEIVTPKFVDKLKTLELVGKHIDVSAFAENIKLQTPPDMNFKVEVVPSANNTND